jgi:sulfur relay (sulfurtransferase) complex TusBCD TusD component (DsrE family)
VFQTFYYFTAVSQSLKNYLPHEYNYKKVLLASNEKQQLKTVAECTQLEGITKDEVKPL